MLKKLFIPAKTTITRIRPIASRSEVSTIQGKLGNLFILRTKTGFTLVEILIGLLISVIVISALYFVFISGVRQSVSGADKLKGFHRLRIVVETLKDDIREGVEVKLPELNKGFSSSLEFNKFVSALKDGVEPRTRKVTYVFDPKEKRLTGLYGDDTELINTQLFEKVEFQQYSVGNKIFIRLHFVVRRNEDDPKNLISIYQSVGLRHYNSRLAQKYWYVLPEFRPQGEFE